MLGYVEYVIEDGHQLSAGVGSVQQVVHMLHQLLDKTYRTSTYSNMNEEMMEYDGKQR